MRIVRLLSSSQRMGAFEFAFRRVAKGHDFVPDANSGSCVEKGVFNQNFGPHVLNQGLLNSIKRSELEKFKIVRPKSMPVAR